MAICFAFASFSQLYIGYPKSKINTEIANTTVSSIITQSNDGTYTLSVTFSDGHFGAYIFDDLTNNCTLYVLGFADKGTYKQVLKNTKKKFNKASDYKDSWYLPRIGYTCVISTFNIKGIDIIVVYPVAKLTEIINLRRTVEEQYSY